jgi:5-(hydroxymethyl)furfural/furfural oxidase
MRRKMTSAKLTRSSDVIVIGAGASGCVLAGRLSEIPGKRVLLIEAGPDAPPGCEHADIRDPYPASSGNAAFFWSGLTAEAGADPGDGRPRNSAPYLQAVGVGGGSNINGMFADRGPPSDYDEWCDMGARGWSWNDVLPYFKKLEKDRDFSGPLHGNEGPIPIRRVRPEQWGPFAKAIAKAFGRRGFAMVDDINGDDRDGVSSAPMNCLPDRRVSASMAYLTDEVRRRPNLTILVDAAVVQLEICDRQIRSVSVRTPEGLRIISAPEVIVACGAIHSPALLLRSGIGPAEQLRRLGIEVVHDLRGVGRNLLNHPMVFLAMHLRSAGMQPLEQRAWQQNLLRYSSNAADCAKHDMLLLPGSKAAWHPLGRRLGGLAVFVQKAYSRGSVEIVSAEHCVMPRVRFNLLDDSRDFERMVDGLRMALEVLSDDEVLRVRNEVFRPNVALGARLAKRSAWNWLQAWVISTALRVGPLRRAVLRKSTLDIRSMSTDNEAMRNYVRLYAQAVYHVCGTCRMGGAEDPEAVVDSSCRVLGVRGLRVVDASVFPSVPSAASHLPVLMVAEKMADRIKLDWEHMTASARDD